LCGVPEDEHGADGAVLANIGDPDLAQAPRQGPGPQDRAQARSQAVQIL